MLRDSSEDDFDANDEPTTAGAKEIEYTDASLEAEIREAIYESDDPSNPVPDWIAISVIKSHFPDGFAKHSDFITNAVWAHTRRITGKVCRNLKPEVPPKQPLISGFEYLQSHYEVERPEGATVVVRRVERAGLTTKERRRIARQLQSTGEAWIRHGDELERETDALIAAGVLESDDE